MSISQKLSGELKQLAGHAGPSLRTVCVAVPPGRADMAIDFTAVDSLSCSLREIRVRVPSLSGASVDVLRQWATDLCRRVTYLLENIGPLEVDADAGQVLVRSTPPDRQADATTFYEVLLQSHAVGVDLIDLAHIRQRLALGAFQPNGGEQPLFHEDTEQPLQKFFCTVRRNAPFLPHLANRGVASIAQPLRDEFGFLVSPAAKLGARRIPDLWQVALLNLEIAVHPVLGKNLLLRVVQYAFAP